MNMERIKAALESARHELSTLSGLQAFDGAAPDRRWELDHSKVVRELDEAIKSFDSDTRPS